MPFERSLEIERRLDVVLRLIRTGQFSTPKLAEKVGVSIPTISRCVTALRERGHDIRTERAINGWRHILSEDETPIGHGQRSKAAKKSRGLSHYAD